MPDWLIAHAQLWALGTAVVVSVIWSRPHWPGSWHWRLALAGLCLAAAVPLAADLDPLGDARRPLPGGTAQGAVSGVLDRAGSGGMRIEVGTGTAVDELGAYVTGLGSARAMVLSEAVLSFPTAHVAFVAAHELAHAERRDVNRVVLASSAGMVATLGLLRWVLTQGPRPSQEHESRTVAVVLAVVAVAHLALTPVANARSRASELLADQRALELTGDPEASIELQRWLVSIGAAEETYPVWYGYLLASHPSAGDRIARAVSYAGRHGINHR